MSEFSERGDSDFFYFIGRLIRTDKIEPADTGGVMIMKDQEIRGLYSPAFEHDNCGIGAVVNKDGRKSKT